MPPALFRVEMPGGAVRLAGGDATDGPRWLLPAESSIDALISAGAAAIADALRAPTPEAAPPDVRILAPAGSQEVWAAGVTYERSRAARVEESAEPSPYDRVYAAERPELFAKAAGWRVRGPSDAIGVRADSTWDVPEPELALVLDATGAIAGYAIGDDVSSRAIEGANTLYLPQAKTYEASCALGPAIVPASTVAAPFDIRMRIDRDGETVYDEATSSSSMARSFEHLTAYLGRALAFPFGAILLTGTGIVPDPPFTLVAGDEVRISIEGLGELVNRVEPIGHAP
jgi:2-dehydro-3-deoxy-D-arabinonate dehydratase